MISTKIYNLLPKYFFFLFLNIKNISPIFKIFKFLKSQYFFIDLLKYSSIKISFYIYLSKIILL